MHKSLETHLNHKAIDEGVKRCNLKRLFWVYGETWWASLSKRIHQEILWLEQVFGIFTVTTGFPCVQCPEM